MFHVSLPGSPGAGACSAGDLLVCAHTGFCLLGMGSFTRELGRGGQGVVEAKGTGAYNTIPFVFSWLAAGRRGRHGRHGPVFQKTRVGIVGGMRLARGLLLRVCPALESTCSRRHLPYHVVTACVECCLSRFRDFSDPSKGWLGGEGDARIPRWRACGGVCGRGD